MSARAALAALPAAHDAGQPRGITSVCSAHPQVIAAGLIEAHEAGQIACIEATCNQVNQEGGYTGLQPQDFADRVFAIADQLNVPRAQILLGGDHLGPNPWRHLPADQAMERAEIMTHAYARAGFAKIHADASMACADDPVPLPDEQIAARAARLVAAAEAGARDGGHEPPLYIIGTEVPVPGGVAEELDSLIPTAPGDAARTLELHRQTFAAQGLDDAMTRVVAMVVQPGVEFGHANLIRFDPAGAADLAQWRAGVLFEAHSTDYQSAQALRALVESGFGILKVGPGLTFALREALYGLDLIARVLGRDLEPLPDVMERAMLAAPAHWQGYYQGDDAKLLRHYSYSDRIRYYWTAPEAEQAVDRLMQALDGQDLPETLVSQYLPREYEALTQGAVAPRAPDLLRAAIRRALRPYTLACAQA